MKICQHYCFTFNDKKRKWSNSCYLILCQVHLPIRELNVAWIFSWFRNFHAICPKSLHCELCHVCKPPARRAARACSILRSRGCNVTIGWRRDPDNCESTYISKTVNTVCNLIEACVLCVYSIPISFQKCCRFFLFKTNHWFFEDKRKKIGNI